LHIWGLFLLYGLYFGLTEGVERAYVVDLVGEENRGTAFGWFHLTVGIGALPASLIFGAIWQTFGPHIAFIIGACLAVIASFMLASMVRKK
jgi:MFS family permease